MKCKDCSACKLGWFTSSPDEYTCTAVQEPFKIGKDIDIECIAYPTSDKPIKFTYGPGEYDWHITDNNDGTMTLSKKITINELINIIIMREQND
jgi:hypothetical protein